MQYLYLSIAILSEVLATSALKASEQFTRPLPSLIVVIGYGIAFYTLSLTLRSLPISVVYALWSGLGIALIAIVEAVYFKQPLNLPTYAGIGLIILGVVVVEISAQNTHS